MKRYQVSVIKKRELSMKEAVKKAVDLIGGFERYVRPGQRVMLKPNYTGDLDPKEGAVTSVEIQEAIIELLKEYGVTDITIGEGSGTIHIGTMKIFEHVGVAEMAKRQGVRLVDLNRCPTVEKTHPGFREIESVKMSAEIYQYDLIINLPVMKTHAQCVFTCAVKNMKGAVAPAEKRRFHAIHLHQAIADFNLVLPKMLTIVDGIVGQEGMGPAEGEPVPLDLILAGENSLAVDGVALRIMNIDPKLVKHIVLAEETGLGTYRLDRIDVLGEDLEQFTYKFRLAQTDLKSYDGVEIYEKNACSGCINSLVIALNRMQNQGDLGKFQGLQVSIGTGKPECEYRKFFCIGKCSRANYEKEKALGKPVHFIAGCAPAALEIEERIREVYGIDRPGTNR